MTQTGPAAQDDVLLPSGWSEANQASSLLFRLDGLDLHLISGSRFEAVADAVGTPAGIHLSPAALRFRQHRDLDGRDEAYDHLILLEPAAAPWRDPPACSSFPSSRSRAPSRQPAVVPGARLSRHQGDVGGADPPCGDRSGGVGPPLSTPTPFPDGPVPRRAADRGPLRLQPSCTDWSPTTTSPTAMPSTRPFSVP